MKSLGIMNRRNNPAETSPEMLESTVRDRGGIELPHVIVGVVAVGAILIAYNVGQGNPDSPEGATAPSTTVEPEYVFDQTTDSLSSTPPLDGTATGEIAGQTVETSPPPVGVATAPVASESDPTSTNVSIPTEPQNVIYQWVDGEGNPRTLNCSGIPAVFQTVYFKGQYGEGYSLYMGADQFMTGNVNDQETNPFLLRKGNENLADAIIQQSGNIYSGATYAPGSYNVNDLRDPTDPSEGGTVAMGSNCVDSNSGTIWMPNFIPSS